MSLELKFKKIHSIKLSETVKLIASSNKLLELLNILFYEDYFQFFNDSYNR